MLQIRRDRALERLRLRGAVSVEAEIEAGLLGPAEDVVVDAVQIREVDRRPRRHDEDAGSNRFDRRRVPVDAPSRRETA
jgi:hypothetical protein